MEMLHEVGTAEPECRLEVDCRICSSKSSSEYLRARDYRVVQCQECGLWYVNPQPSPRELDAFYTGFDQTDNWRSDGEEGFDRQIRDLILRFRRSGSVLDVGSARGNALIPLRQAGFNVFGIEPSSKDSEFARSVNGIPTFTGTVEEFLSTHSRQTFDVVTILNVLEHLRDPRKVLVSLRDVLSDAGLVVIVVPDARLHAFVGSVREKLGFDNPFWLDGQTHTLVGFDPPMHLSSFEPRTLSMLLRRCGYRSLVLKNAPVVYKGPTWKDVTKFLLYRFPEVVYCVTFGRLLLGYSTVVVAKKEILRA